MMSRCGNFLNRQKNGRAPTWATLLFALCFLAPLQADAKEVLLPSKSTAAKCANWFSGIRERLFLHYNYTINPDGLNAVSAAEYNKAWLRTTALDLRKNRKFLKNAIRDEHPQIPFLERLGFKFDEKNGHVIPVMNEIAVRHEVIIKELITAGKVEERDILRPARMFEITDGGKRKIIPVALSADPPAGAKPVVEIVGSEEFFNFIAGGYWPIGEIMPVNRTDISFAFHDLGHLGAFERNPDFMKAVKDFARTRVAEGRFEIDGPKTNLIFESLTLGRMDARSSFDAGLSRLGISGRAEAEPWTETEFRNALSNVSGDGISKEVAEAYAIRHKTIEDLGGARADGISSERARFPLTVPYPNLIENPKSLLELAYDAKTPKAKRVAFSKYLAAMDHTTRMKPSDWLTELTFSDKLNVDSKIYRYICLSGIFARKTSFYEGFCRISGSH